MKKFKRFFRGLKKLLCCCWCKTRQQHEEAEEYVAGDSPRLAEAEEGGVCEESGSLADSSSETAQSLQVACGQSPERESVQSLPEECVAVEELVSEADKTSDDGDAYIDEALIEKIYALIEDEEPRKPSATEAPMSAKATPSPSGVQGEAEGQTERRAARRRRRRKNKVQHEDNGGERPLVCGKKNKKRQESTVKVAVPVPPNRRRHVIGTWGESIRQLQHQYPAVRVSVPPPQDLKSREVMIEGPKTQAEAVAQQITLRLQAVEEKLRQAEQRRQARKTVVVKVEVAPYMRGHVVGYRGDALRRLAQEHPAVTVMVPRPGNTRTATVSIRGPRDEAAAVADCVRARVQAACQQQRQRQVNKMK